MGLIFHNSIPMRPEKGPFPAHYSESNHYALAFTPSEEVRIAAAPHAVQCRAPALPWADCGSRARTPQDPSS